MIERTLQSHLLEVAGRYPVVTLTGPRQSGKTTLSRMAFPGHPYVSVENQANREFALEDPVGFLSRYPEGAVIDEVQRAPQLMSYLQGNVDEDPRPGRFILTGSQNLALIEAATQSLAGRTALLQLLPLDHEEVQRFPCTPDDLFSALWHGGYPRIFDRDLPASEWLANYTATYVERDVRQLLQVGDLTLFQTFLRLSAGRVGGILNLASLAADCGINAMTARSWLSVLEASYVAYRLPPFHANLGKRLSKRPKLYFYDSGLVCSLLGIEAPEQLATHPLRGAIFECWAVGEIFKRYTHRGKRPRLYYFRQRDRLEVDLLIERGSSLTAVEIKSSRTPSSSFFKAFGQLEKTLAAAPEGGLRLTERRVLYGGDEEQVRQGGLLVPWSRVSRHDW